MRLHHVGIVVENIARHARLYSEHFGMQPLSEVVPDSTQRVEVQFLGEPAQVSLELIQPLGEDSPVRRALEKGGGYNHLCFEVDDICESVRQAEAKGAICVRQPVPAAAFGGRRIAFLFFREIGLIEFVEAPSR
jgi:methylmalonyl-CoA/ethylmalonyl-CoA epimerase